MAAPQTTRLPASTDAVDRILAAAEALFAEHGFDAVSMNAIAEAAGVSKANVFHHFICKNDLYIAVLRNACRDSAQHLDDLGNDNTDLTARLPQFARAHLENLLEHAQVARLMLRELLSDNPRHGQELAEKVYGEKFSRFVAILRAGQQAGALRADIDPAMVATVLLGANVFFFESRAVLRHFPDVTFTQQPERYSTMLAELLLHGILPPDSATTKNRNRT
ncbi:MAG TPA: TetR/AcrR family transcriptional regulator [Acidiferrobacterales bacterium]|nr:TetR/AcrR family transcriptional regulator [Acidiferrobacterales bacterium]